VIFFSVLFFFFSFFRPPRRGSIKPLPSRVAPLLRSRQGSFVGPDFPPFLPLVRIHGVPLTSDGIFAFVPNAFVLVTGVRNPCLTLSTQKHCQSLSIPRAERAGRHSSDLFLTFGPRLLQFPHFFQSSVLSIETDRVPLTKFRQLDTRNGPALRPPSFLLSCSRQKS